MNSFGKTKRLLKKTDYDHVFEQATKLVNSEFVILYRANTMECARLGLALSKKSIPKAHDRNRIKRILRETFRTSRLPAIDMVFLAKRGVAEVENKAIITGLDKIWDKLIGLYVT